jgi:hypothetical protein
MRWGEGDFSGLDTTIKQFFKSVFNRELAVF